MLRKQEPNLRWREYASSSQLECNPVLDDTPFLSLPIPKSFSVQLWQKKEWSQATLYALFYLEQPPILSQHLEEERNYVHIKEKN